MRDAALGRLASLPDELVAAVVATLTSERDANTLTLVNHWLLLTVRRNNCLWRQFTMRRFPPLRSIPSPGVTLDWRSVCIQHFQIPAPRQQTLTLTPFSSTDAHREWQGEGIAVHSSRILALLGRGSVPTWVEGAATWPTLGDFYFTVRLFDDSAGCVQLLEWTGRFAKLADMCASRTPSIVPGRGGEGFMVCQPQDLPDVLRRAMDDREFADVEFWNNLRLVVYVTHKFRTTCLLETRLRQELLFVEQTYGDTDRYPKGATIWVEASIPELGQEKVADYGLPLHLSFNYPEYLVDAELDEDSSEEYNELNEEQLVAFLQMCCTGWT